MLHIRLGALIRDLRATDALVIVDTPPLLPVSDARLVAPHADGVLLLIAVGSQRPAHLAGAIERLALVDAQPIGVVLNKAGAELRSVGGYYTYSSTDRVAPSVDEPAVAPPLELR
jgi:Mrp family chromosome partitioning ATPase